MVAGDMVAGEGTILIHPAEGSIREYIASLEKMITLNPSRLLPAHGKILSPGISILKEYIAHRKMRLTQVLSCLGNSPTTALDIARMIYTDLQEQFLPIASIQVQCGLIFLEEERLVRSQGTYWTVI
jgi:hydroxyacylglutathione hydrolase